MAVGRKNSFFEQEESPAEVGSGRNSHLLWGSLMIMFLKYSCSASSRFLEENSSPKALSCEI